MFFFIKKSSLVIDCFTDSRTAFEYSKIDFANKFLPDWWKKLPKQIDATFYPIPTMKTCAGVINLYRTGLVLPMWSELAVKVGRVGSRDIAWQYADLASNAEVHTPDQYGDYYPTEKYAHLKLTSPWFINYNKSVKTLWSQPTFSMESLGDYVMLPGVVDLQASPTVNVNFFFIRDRYEDKVVNINFNQPVAQIIPLTDKKIELKHHLISNQEMRQKNFQRTHFLNSYSKQVEQGCPFNHRSS